MCVLKPTLAPDMNTTHRSEIMQRWRAVQHELLPELRNEVGILTPKLEKDALGKYSVNDYIILRINADSCE
jgi:hypothetical protein